MYDHDTPAGTVHDDPARNHTITVQDAERRVQALPAGSGLFHDVRLLARMLRAQALGHFFVNAWAVATAVAALVYVATIPDAVPDVIPFVGFVDDAAVVGAAVGVLRGELRRFTAWEATKA